MGIGGLVAFATFLLGCLASWIAPSGKLRNWLLGITAAAVVIILSFVAGFRWRGRNQPEEPRLVSVEVPVPSPADKLAVRRVVWRSQEFEMLQVYVRPESFDPSQLNRYWVPAEEGGKATTAIVDAVRNLRVHEWHYGVDSRNVRFEFKSMLFPGGTNVAIVATNERWFVPTYDKHGSIAQERQQLRTYESTYLLRKLNGRWLIEEEVAPYVEPGGP